VQVFLQLAWREFHELKWPVAAALAIATLAPLLSALQISEMAWFWVQFNLVFYPFAAGLLFGMHLAAGERGRRTASFLAATPVSPRVLGTSKLLCTALAALLPIVQLGVLGGLVKSLAGPVAASQSIWMYCGASAVCTLQILLIVGVCGLGQKTELLAAGRGLLALAAWGTIALGVSHYPQWRLLQLVRYLGPPIDWFDPQELSGINEVWLRVAGFIAVEATLLALMITFVARYRRAIEPLIEALPWRWRLPGWLPVRLPSPLAALCWKQLRETVPFGLMVLVLSLLLSVVWSLAVVDERAGEPFVRHKALTAVYIFATAAGAGGFALAMFLGVGLFAYDLEPRTNTFWRSRPISAQQWFWTKFAAGFVALVVTVGLPGRHRDPLAIRPGNMASVRLVLYPAVLVLHVFGRRAGHVPRSSHSLCRGAGGRPADDDDLRTAILGLHARLGSDRFAASGVLPDGRRNSDRARLASGHARLCVPHVVTAFVDCSFNP